MRLFTATSNDNDFVSFIAPILRDKHIVALDGMELTGKTDWFSNLILQAAGRGKIIHTDDYIKKQNIAYGLYILKSRKKLIDDIQLQSRTLVVVEGIMIKEKLRSIGVSSDLWIYIKKMTNYGWQERDWLEKLLLKNMAHQA